MNTDNNAFETLKSTLRHGDIPTKNSLLYLLFSRYIGEQMEGERVLCHTLFSKITFLSKKYRWPADLRYWCHTYRQMATQRTSSSSVARQEEETEYAIAAIARLQAFRYHTDIPTELKERFPKRQKSEPLPHNTGEMTPERFVLLEKKDGPAGEYLGISDQWPDHHYRISDQKLPELDRRSLRDMSALPDIFPLVVHLIDSQMDGEVVYPLHLVIQPDYLVDVTAISECFEPDGVNILKYLLRKLTPTSPNHYLLIGNVANTFLDELIRDPSLNFKTLLSKIFQQYPLEWIRYNDQQITAILQQLKQHFTTLKYAVTTLLPANGISPQSTVLEPSFYSAKYGIQGRLDLFLMNEAKSSASIVELKSGSVYRPNAYGLNTNHYIQALLYDRLIYSVFPGIKRMGYILYSKSSKEPLRYAPVIRDLQLRALTVRNRIAYIDRALCQPESLQTLLQQLVRIAERPHRGFFTKEAKAFAQAYTLSSTLDQEYYRAHILFMAREHQVARLGRGGQHNRRGVASIWLTTQEEKKLRYEIVDQLTYHSGDTSGPRPVLVMKRKASAKEEFSNFRPGDIGILYPDVGEASALHHQIYKCSIVTIDEQQIVLRLRSAQFVEQHFREYAHWNLEHDSLDGNFNRSIQGLYRFLCADRNKKNLIYGLHPPQLPAGAPPSTPDLPHLHPTQQDILNRMKASRDYFLLWGPPGTGKTSVILKYFVKYLMEHTQERILLLAYTNRAVDEICQSVEDLGESCASSYIRLGSRYATANQYSKCLLQNAVEDKTNRRDIISFLSSKRIFISTLASFNNNHILLQSIPFDTLVVDEAGQILEAALAPVLTLFRRFVLIGDHRQLPAVTTQSEKHLHTEVQPLKDIGLHRLDRSLFERLFNRARAKHWTHAYGMLEYQGRMHQDIVRFVASDFYEDHLFPLPQVERLFRPAFYPEPIHPVTDLQRALQKHRCVFIPTPSDPTSITGKTNRHEARAIVKLLSAIQGFLDNTGALCSVGVITPYRAQIAQIKQQLVGGQWEGDTLTIDTVERYQGSARDIILLSLCTNYPSQIQFIGQTSKGALNKKLNVALTRAKEQIIVLGNPTILRNDKSLEAWMNYAHKITLEGETGTAGE